MEVTTWRDDGSLWRLWREVKYQWSRGGVCALPKVENLTALELARWIYAAHVETSQWCPFVHVTLRDDLPLAQVWQSARGGVLFVETDEPDDVPAQCIKMAKDGAFVLLISGVFSERLSVWGTTWVQHAAAHHIVAMDPDLEAVRQGMLLHAKNAAQVHLSGEAGGLAPSLVRWVHGVLDEEPLAYFRGEQGEYVQGRWMCFEQVGELSQAHRELLLRQVSERTQRQRRGYHRLAKAERPDDEVVASYLGESVQTVEVLRALLSVGPSPLSIYFEGEVGTGKQQLARLVHTISGRAGDFVVLNVASLGEQWQEVVDDQLNAATSGTLLIQHVEQLTSAQQVYLLSALRVGAMDIRVLSSSSEDLDGCVRRGTFRRDLYGRLSGVTMRIDPLRARMVDLDALVEHMLTTIWGELPVTCCTKDAWTLLRSYHWPGNTVQLFDVIRQAAALVEPGTPLSEASLSMVSLMARPVPMFTVELQEQAEWGLSSHVVKQIRAMTFEIPPFRSRSMASRLHALRAVLSGKVLSVEAINCLVAQPWWGNLFELRTRLTPLLSLSQGVIDLEVLSSQMPEVINGGDRAPLKVVLSPTSIADDRVGGLTWDVEVGAVLIGRVANWRVFEEAASSGDARAQAVCDAVSAVCVGYEPWCLDLSFLRRLSRAHVLLSYGEDGLDVEVLPRAGMRVEVESFEPGYGKHALKAGERGTVGEAGSLTWIRAKTNAVYLRLFVFSGDASFEMWSEAAAQRLQDTTTWDMGTLNTQQEHLHIKPLMPKDQASHIWAVNALEAETWTDILFSYRGGSLKRHLTHALREFEGDLAYARIIDFVRHVPRLSQYLSRLYKLPENEILRDSLRARYTALDDSQDMFAYLPKGIREVLLVQG